MIKRAFDLVVGALLLAVTSPAWLVIALAVRLDSPGPVIFRAARMGRHGEPFTMYKFRTMADHSSGSAVTAAGDARITRVGRFLRRWKLDELPQLWNVVKGDMSLVGPRPEDPGFLPWYGDASQEVLSVRPGLTGPTVIAYRDEARMLAGAEDVDAAYVERILPAKLALDREYVRTRSFMGDLRILAGTVRSIGRRA